MVNIGLFSVFHYDMDGSVKSKWKMSGERRLGSGGARETRGWPDADNARLARRGAAEDGVGQHEAGMRVATLCVGRRYSRLKMAH